MRHAARPWISGAKAGAGRRLPVRPAVLHPTPHTSPPILISTRRSSSLSPSPRPSPEPLRMPMDQPREDYATPTLYTLSYISRILRLILYTGLGLGISGYAAYEALHLYVEHALLLPAVEGWEDEYVSWTGPAQSGGTASALGWKGRHALRGAYMCQEYGAGSVRGSIGREGGKVNDVDRGYELALEYLRVAEEQARKKGMVFPDRAVGAAVASSGAEVDRVAVDLTLLKAGILERIGTITTLKQARGLYEDVLSSVGTGSGNVNPVTSGTAGEQAVRQAREMRLLAKIGDLAQRTGGDGAVWWRRGLERAGLKVGVSPESSTSPSALASVPVKKASSWFSFGGSSSSASSSSEATSSTTLSPKSSSTAITKLASPVQRAAITLLIHLEANQATTSQFAASASTQEYALSLLPLASSSSDLTASNDAGSDLHTTWLSHRRALITLHNASVTHAQRSSSSATRGAKTALDLAESAYSQAEETLSSLSPTSSVDSRPPAKQLLKDARALAAEAAYTKGVLLERQVVTTTVGQDQNLELELAKECFERARTLSEEADTEGETAGRTTVGSGKGEGSKYWRAWARVSERLEKERGVGR